MRGVKPTEVGAALRLSLEGPGLHSGRPSRVRAWSCPGPLAFVRDGVVFPLARLTPSGDRRSTELHGEGFLLRTVEHLCAALAALGLHSGVRLSVDGEECPLLDGGAGAYLGALRMLESVRSCPTLRVQAEGEVRVANSVYRFTPPAPGEVAATPVVSVAIDFGDPRLAADACWSGDLEDFERRIAPARTFGFARELGELIDRGLASHVDKESVVLVTDTEILSAGAPFCSDEPARHKLLDLVGDLFVWGGPPAGSVHAILPGHAATHAAVRQALACGILNHRA